VNEKLVASPGWFVPVKSCASNFTASPAASNSDSRMNLK